MCGEEWEIEFVKNILDFILYVKLWMQMADQSFNKVTKHQEFTDFWKEVS